LTEAPWRPEILADIELLALFIPDDGDLTTALRTYASLDALVSLVAPPHGSTIRECQVRYGNVAPDFPRHDLLSDEFPPNLRDLYDGLYDEMNFVHASKLGGWPSCIQSEPLWYLREKDDDFSFAFQIDSESEAGLMWGDSGTVYFARSQRDLRKWTFDVQFY
jgi:hypothetical protein